MARRLTPALSLSQGCSPRTIHSRVVTDIRHHLSLFVAPFWSFFVRWCGPTRSASSLRGPRALLTSFARRLAHAATFTVHTQCVRSPCAPLTQGRAFAPPHALERSPRSQVASLR